jgi:hypothetical protein
MDRKALLVSALVSGLLPIYFLIASCFIRTIKNIFAPEKAESGIDNLSVYHKERPKK